MKKVLRQETEDDVIDNLKARAENVSNTMKKRLAEGRAVSTHCLVWPETRIKTDEGVFVDHPVIAEVPDEAKKRKDFLQAMVRRTHAYAIIFVEKLEDMLVVHFECHKGTRTWTTPIQWQGDKKREGTTKIENDIKCLNLLWSTSRGSA